MIAGDDSTRAVEMRVQSRNKTMVLAHLIRWIGTGFLCYALSLAAHASPPRKSPSRPAAPESNAAVVRLDGVEYVDAADFIKRLGLQVADGTRPGQKLVMKNASWEVELEADTREARINDLRVILGQSVRPARRTLRISRIDAEKLFRPLLRPGERPVLIPDLKIIALDPGHGGHDPGNLGMKMREKELALDVANRLKKLLEARGFRVILTRSTDKFIELEDRPEIASKAGADLFISIHFNAFQNPLIHGMETFVMTPQYHASVLPEQDKSRITQNFPNNRWDAWNVLLGYHLHRSLLKATGSMDRGLRRMRWAVVRPAECPAVLVELGFLTNVTEAKKAAMPSHRQAMAEAIAKGIDQYGYVLEAARAARTPKN